MGESLYWLGFSSFSGIGPIRFAKLLNRFGEARVAWNASVQELKEIIGVALSEEFVDFKKKFSLEKYVEQLAHANVEFITLSDEHYPLLLKQIPKAPYVLYYKGNKEILNQGGNSIYLGVVGTRKITDYGRQVTTMITRELVDAGCVINSGIALGVDATAHQATLAAQGETIAVLGCGVDCCSPMENKPLYDSIVANKGVVVSEYRLGMSPNKGSFLSRNRIIAGLSHGVVVTEGAIDSGALVTAKDAIKFGRKVFAVPGPVTSSLSQAPYQLIKEGGTIVSSGKEILMVLGMNNELGKRKIRQLKGDSAQEQRILDLLAEQDLHFDELVKRIQIDPSKLGTMLSLMEMKGMIKNLSAGFFSVVS